MRTLNLDILKEGLPGITPSHYKQAYELEKKAAFSTSHTDENPLSHFVLLRSAAALAYRAKLYRESERLIEICKSESPPEWIIEELDDIVKLMKKSKNKVRAKKNSSILAVEGTLTQVNSDENEITGKDGTEDLNFSIIVSRKLLAELVKNHWFKKVSIQARQTPHGVMVLEKISAAA